MKKIALILLSAAILLSLCACGEKAPEASPAASEAPAEESTIVIEAPPAEDAAPLSQVLDSINENTEVGTAGSSLRAAQSAAMLMDWCAETSLDAEQVRAAAVEWLSPMGNDAQTEFAQKLELVDTMCLELIHKDGTSLLESAGYASSSYPWDEAAYEKYTAVLDAVGVEQG